MGSITKRGKRYLARAQYTRNYIPNNASKVFDSELEALVWIEKTEKSMRLGKSQSIDTTKKVKDAVIRYRDEVSPTKKSKEYEINRLNYFLRMKSFPSEIPLHTLITRDIATWRIVVIFPTHPRIVRFHYLVQCLKWLGLNGTGWRKILLVI